MKSIFSFAYGTNIKPLFCRVVMTTPYSVNPFVERLKINISPYLPDEEDVDGDSSDDEVDAVSVKV